MWYIHAVKYFSALKRKELLQYATVWMSVKDIMLSEISQSQKNRYYMIVQVSRIIKTIEKESRMVFAKSWKKGRNGTYIV